MFSKQKYLTAKLNNFYIDLFESDQIDQGTLDTLIEELESMEVPELYKLCMEYEVRIIQTEFMDAFGNFKG